MQKFCQSFGVWLELHFAWRGRETDNSFMLLPFPIFLSFSADLKKRRDPAKRSPYERWTPFPPLPAGKKHCNRSDWKVRRFILEAVFARWNWFQRAPNPQPNLRSQVFFLSRATWHRSNTPKFVVSHLGNTSHIGTNTPKFVPSRWGWPPFDPLKPGPASSVVGSEVADWFLKSCNCNCWGSGPSWCYSWPQVPSATWEVGWYKQLGDWPGTELLTPTRRPTSWLSSSSSASSSSSSSSSSSRSSMPSSCKALSRRCTWPQDKHYNFRPKSFGISIPSWPKVLQNDSLQLSLL